MTACRSPAIQRRAGRGGRGALASGLVTNADYAARYHTDRRHADFRAARDGARLHARGALHHRLGPGRRGDPLLLRQAAPLRQRVLQQRHRRRSRRGRRRVSGHALGCLGINHKNLRHGARQPRRRARPHARFPVWARPRADHRGCRLSVLHLAGARPQPAGLGQKRQIEGRPDRHRAMADLDVAGRPRKHHLKQAEEAASGRYRHRRMRPPISSTANWTGWRARYS